MEEIWKDIPEYEGMYQVSNTGYVKGLDRIDSNSRRHKERILKPCIANGYLQVILSKNSIHCKKIIHHLVTEVFLGPCPPKKQRNHIDGNKTNNRSDNLEYCTASENHFHSYRVLGKQAARGSRQGGSKLTEKQVIDIRELYATGNYNFVELSNLFNVCDTNISKIIKRKSWTHV